MNSAREFLFNEMKNETKQMMGIVNEQYLKYVVDAWMDDKNNSKHRFDIIKKYYPNSNKILDDIEDIRDRLSLRHIITVGRPHFSELYNKIEILIFDIDEIYKQIKKCKRKKFTNCGV